MDERDSGIPRFFFKASYTRLHAIEHVCSSVDVGRQECRKYLRCATFSISVVYFTSASAYSALISTRTVSAELALQTKSRLFALLLYNVI